MLHGLFCCEAVRVAEADLPAKTPLFRFVLWTRESHEIPTSFSDEDAHTIIVTKTNEQATPPQRFVRVFLVNEEKHYCDSRCPKPCSRRFGYNFAETDEHTLGLRGTDDDEDYRQRRE